jgi:hypothetical protein
MIKVMFFIVEIRIFHIVVSIIVFIVNIESLNEVSILNSYNSIYKIYITHKESL